LFRFPHSLIAVAKSLRWILLSPQKRSFCGDPFFWIGFGRPIYGLPAPHAALAARPRRAVAAMQPLFGPGLRAGFAVFLRENTRVTVFFPGACP
ncbi:MAG: hypothetical protein PT965_02845, partial [Clostridia bacterium]|nr:hypothetical protein [Clostridia bacterium]